VFLLSNAKSPRILWLAFLAVGASAFFLLWKFDPVTVGFFPPCIFYKVTNLYCPGCGSTRACDALIEGRLSNAFGYNPLFIVCLPLVFFFLLRSVWLGIVKNEVFEVHHRYSKYLLVLAIVIVAYGVARNLPFDEFAWMRP
jgi:hypothetical protein